jgi:chorismate-pyruvate lyase
VLVKQDPEPWANGKREVSLTCAGREVCHADSENRIYNQDVIDLLDSGDYGLGQALATCEIKPAFHLINTGQNHDSFWRRYTLKDAGVSMRIDERFLKADFDGS